VFDLHGGAISLTAASGDVFATFSGFDRQLHVFKVGEESPIHSLTTPSEASGLSFSPDGSSLLVGLYSGAALTYDLKQFKEPRERCAHHTAALRRFAFLGNSVISGLCCFSLSFLFSHISCSAGDDHVARVWGSDVTVRHGDFVRGLAVQEGALVTASWDKTLRVTKL
jgi:WD40 repeat protein